MGIDLGLQCHQLTLPLLFLLFHILDHQMMDLLCHNIEGICQCRDFIVANRLKRHILKLPLLHLFHGLHQGLHRLGYHTGEQNRDQDRRHKKRRGDQHIGQLCLLTVSQQFFQIGYPHYGPVGAVGF